MLPGWPRAGQEKQAHPSGTHLAAQRAGRVLPALGTALCPREGRNHQRGLLAQAKAEAIPIQAQA